MSARRAVLIALLVGVASTGVALYLSGRWPAAPKAQAQEQLGAWVRGGNGLPDHVRPRRQMPPEGRQRMRAAAERHARAMAGRPPRPGRIVVPPLPGDRDAPPRMDSGDPNPDRLNQPGLAFSDRFAGDVPLPLGEPALSPVEGGAGEGVE